MPQRKPAWGEGLGWIPVLWLALAAALCTAGYFICTSVLATPPASSRVDFLYPGSVSVGPDGTLVVSDKGDRRLVGVAANGSLKFALKGGKRSGGFYAGKPVGFCADGTFVVSDTLSSLSSSNAQRDSLLAFSATGRFERVLYSRSYSTEEEADYSKHMIYAQAGPDFVSWFLPDPDGVWALHVLPIDGGKELAPRRFEGFDVYATVDTVLTSRDEVYLLERNGDILRRVGSGPLERWFANDEGILRFPSAMSAGKGGEIHVLDGKLSVFRILPPGNAKRVVTVLDRSIAKAAGYAKPFELATLAIGPGGSIYGPDEATGEVLGYSADGTLKAIAGLPLAGKVAALAMATLILGLFATLALLSLFVLFYVKILRSKTPLLLRQLAVLVPILAAASVAIAWAVFSDMNGRLGEELRHRLELVAQLTALRTDPEYLDAIDLSHGRLSDILGSKDYAALEKVLVEVVNGNADSWNSQVSPNFYVQRDGEWYIIGTIGFVELYPNAWTKPEFSRVLNDGVELFTRYSDVYGQWLSAMRPLWRSDGSIAAVVEVTMSADILDEAGAVAFRSLALGTAGLLVLVVAIFAAFDWILLSSVKQLKKGAEHVAAGDYDILVDVRSKDEIEELGEAFNTMSSEIKRYVDRMASLGRANARFVPREFLVQLGRESITEVGLGDQVLTEMTVLFSDIRGFTGLSETMGPGETMDMLNDYLSRMGPAIRDAGGFVDKYVGDSIMALFPRSPDDAVKAATDMMAALETYRDELRERDEERVDAGIGIHVGKLMLGVIGEEERFESTVIADAVNLASRLESLTKFYGVRSIVSGAVRDRASDPNCPLRFIDLVRVKGRSQSVRIYELVAASDPAFETKLGSSSRYIRAFTLYRNGAFAQAADAFGEFLAQSPGDRAATILRERCLRFVQSGKPSGWEGVTEFHEK